VILVEAVCTGMGVFTAVATVVTIAVVLWGVATVVGSMVGAGVTTVGRIVGTTVVATGVVTAAGCAGCVHPLIITNAMTKIKKPMNFFM